MYPTIQIASLRFSTYSLMTLVGACCALFFLYFRNQRYQIPWKSYFIVLLLALIGVVVGSRAVYLLSVLPELMKNFSWRQLWLNVVEGGFVFYGGLFGALGANYLYLRKTRQDIHRYYNLFLPAYVLFHAFGRIGCFLAGCCYGIAWKYGVHFCTDPEVARLPVQLIEAVLEFLIFGILLVISKKRGTQCKLLPIYLWLYAPCRFILEFFRGDEIRGFFGPLSTSQWISLLIIGVLILRSTLPKYRRQKTVSFEMTQGENRNMPERKKEENNEN
ncbi:MAG: prolipoprotein diacylglyceryl transferase [Faecousia sp.]